MTVEIISKKSTVGGARPGAGRKVGSANRKTREVANRAAESGITPLEVMLEAMHKFRGAGDLGRAAAVAKDAAPYIHPRLNATTIEGLTTPAVSVNISAEAAAAIASQLLREI